MSKMFYTDHLNLPKTLDAKSTTIRIRDDSIMELLLCVRERGLAAENIRLLLVVDNVDGVLVLGEYTLLFAIQGNMFQ